MLLLFIGLLLLATNGAASEAMEQKTSCRNDPEIIGACYKVYGRMLLYNGMPSARIWVVGTKRILGIKQDNQESPRIPAALVAKLSFQNAIYGDFTVCPYTRQTRHKMRLVCVESASHLKQK